MTERPVSVVTGAVGGMGVACAHRFAAAGDDLVLADLDAGALDDLAAEVRARGVDATTAVCDVSDPDAVASLAGAVASLGPLRAVAHTAGLSPTMAEWDTILRVNLTGTVLLLDAIEPLIGDTTVGVCVASQAGHLIGDVSAGLADVLAGATDPDFLARAEAMGVADPGQAYGLSKWAVRQLVIERAPAWGAKRARLVSLSPGIIDTPMGYRELERQPAMEWMIEQTPLGRMGTADEIAAVVEFLCSPAASFVTGTDLLVDGGSTEQVRAAITELTGD